MAGLREIKKRNTKKSILEYAELLFKEKGYSRVKTSEIAKGVDIAEGTIFNYFSSKGELFVAAIFGDFDMEKYEIRIAEEIDEDGIANEILYLTDFYLKKMASVSKNLLREYFSVVYNIDHNESLVTRKSLFRMDEMVMAELRQLFDELKRIHKGIKEFDSVTAVECIYSCVILQFTMYIYSDEFNYSHMLENINRQIKFIIRDIIF